MKEKIKEKYNKTKEWVKEHKAAVIGGVVGTGLGVLGIRSIVKKHNNTKILEAYENSGDENDYSEISSTTDDFEPYCVMRFVEKDDNDEEKILGEVPVAKSYAIDELNEDGIDVNL